MLEVSGLSPNKTYNIATNVDGQTLIDKYNNDDAEFRAHLAIDCSQKSKRLCSEGRSIFNSTKIIDDKMFFTKEHNLSALLLAVDFEKVFDSLDWTFLSKTLTAFNFGRPFIKWVNTFYCNIKSCVMNNFSSTHFDVLRGVRQGDPLSGYVFIIALEILTINIRSCEKIRGVTLCDGKEVKLTAFADDMTTFLKHQSH